MLANGDSFARQLQGEMMWLLIGISRIEVAKLLRMDSSASHFSMETLLSLIVCVARVDDTLRAVQDR